MPVAFSTRIGCSLGGYDHRIQHLHERDVGMELRRFHLQQGSGHQRRRGTRKLMGWRYAGYGD
jgi:hypothetical protein